MSGKFECTTCFNLNLENKFCHDCETDAHVVPMVQTDDPVSQIVESIHAGADPLMDTGGSVSNQQTSSRLAILEDPGYISCLQTPVTGSSQPTSYEDSDDSTMTPALQEDINVYIQPPESELRDEDDDDHTLCPVTEPPTFVMSALTLHAVDSSSTNDTGNQRTGREHACDPIEPPRKRNEPDPISKKAFISVLKLLEMERYYPRKLSWGDVIAVSEVDDTSNVCIEVIKSLMRFDHTAPLTIAPKVFDKRKNKLANSRGNGRKSDNRFSYQREFEQSNDTSPVHPMDVMNIIYNCSNLNLLKTLMAKIFVCQLSIPISFPNKQEGSSTFQLWSLRGIKPEFEAKGEEQCVTSLVEIPHPFVAVIRIGHLQQSKSKFLNDLLRSTINHNTFIHRDCTNGKSPRLISDGTVEAAWYMPAGKRNDKINKMFCFLNLRGDATDYIERTKRLHEVSSVTFLMMDVETLHNKRYEEMCNLLNISERKLVICFLTDSWKKGIDLQMECDECVKWFGENDIQILDAIANWNKNGVLNADTWIEKIKSVLTNCLSEISSGKTIEHIASCFEEIDEIDEHDHECMDAFVKSGNIKSRIDQIAPKNRKSELFPLQGNHWKNFTQLQKEQHRSLVLSDSLENVIATKEEEQRTVCQMQYDLFVKNSEFMKTIYSHLKEAAQSIDKIEYLLTWIGFVFDKCSTELLTRVHSEYFLKRTQFQKCTKDTISKIRTKRLKELNNASQEIANACYDIDNIFREFSQIYRATKSILETKPTIDQDYLGNSPEILAKLVLHGLPLELLDGEVAFVPVIWMQAVFMQIEQLVGSKKKLFVISVVGIQSSGKSTMLNVMFGLQLRVSAGRCTRGVYCQMIPVDKQSLGVDYDYILALDTEGLRAPESQENSHAYDNELATFVIGLGNVTIVNIKGENSSDIHDILQIVTHAMIRIKFQSNVTLNPSCVFVHQNVSAVNAEDKMKLGQDALLQRLDEATRAAAEKEKIPNIQLFSQIINYNKRKHAVYLRDLWQGNPPMAAVNPGYIEDIDELKKMIMHEISETSPHLTISSFFDKLSDMWKAILGENFIFKFKNSEEVKAYDMLEISVSKWKWNLIGESSNLEDDFKKTIFSCKNAPSLKLQLESHISENMLKARDSIQAELLQYFDTSPNKHIIEQWRESCLTQVDTLVTDEIDRLNKRLNECCDLRTLQLNNHRTVEEYKEEIMEQVVKRANDFKKTDGSVLSNSQLTDEFASIWKTLYAKLDSMSEHTDSKQVVRQAFDKELTHTFKSHLALLKKYMAKYALKQQQQHQRFCPTFSVTENDLEFYKENKPSLFQRTVNFFQNLNNVTTYSIKCLNSAQKRCRSNFSEIRSYVDSLYEGDFQPGQATTVVKMITDFFQKIDNNKDKYAFRFKHQFQVEYAVIICEWAIQSLIDIRNFFIEKTDPLAKIKEYEPVFLQCFKQTYTDRVDEAITLNFFAAYFRNWVKIIISEKISSQVASIIVKSDKTLTTKQSFMKKVLIDLGENGEFDKFIEFLNAPEDFLSKAIADYELNWKREASESQKIVVCQVDCEIKKCLNELVKSLERNQCNKFQNMKEYLDRLPESVKRQKQFDSNVFLSLRVTDFGNLSKSLLGEIHQISSKTTELVEDAMNTYESTNQIFSDNLLGCFKQCPFCFAPCCLSDKKHTGEHRALQHYPHGIQGFHETNSKKLINYNCSTVIKSDMLFCYDHSDPKHCVDKYKNYKKHYPDWEIPPDRAGQVSLYWKWFMVRFHEELQKHHKLNAADLPQEWCKITWKQAKNSL